MRYLASPLIAASLLATFASAGRTPPQAETAAVVFFDDFAAPALDRTKWNVTVSGPVYNDEQQAYVDSPEAVKVWRVNTPAAAKKSLVSASQTALSLRSILQQQLWWWMVIGGLLALILEMAVAQGRREHE